MASEYAESSGTARAHSPTVTWFELFYDLVVVAAVALTNDAFLDRPSWQTAVLAATSLAALAWVWFLTTLYINIFPGQDIVRRLILLVQMAAIAVAGLAVDQEHGIDNRLGLVAYGIALALVVALIGWGAKTTRTTVQWRSIVPIVVATVVCWLGALDGISRSGLYLVAAMAISIVPLLVGQYTHWQDASMLRLEHLRERLGLFVLIVLGEGFAQMLSALHFLGAIPRGDVFALVFVLSFAVWWIYFDGTFTEQTNLATVRWRLTLLAHLTLVFGIAGTLDILVVLTTDGGRQLGDATLAYFVTCLSLVLFSFATLTFTAKGHLGVRGWVQIGCGALVVAVGLLQVGAADTSTFSVIGLCAVIVVVNAVIAVWADATSDPHRLRSSLAVALRGEHPAPDDDQAPSG